MERPTKAVDEREKIWQRLLQTSAPVEIKSIKILESGIFAPQEIELNRVVAFIGLHGTGKTLLLRMLEAAFGYMNPVEAPPFIMGDRVDESSKHNQFEPSGVEGVLEIKLKTSRGIITRQVDLSMRAASRRQIWREALESSFAAWGISPLYLFSELAIMFQDYGSVQRAIADDRGKSVSRAKLKALGNILGRSYESITVHSAFVATEFESSGMYVPYISAAIDGRIFDSSTMSQGELWVHYVLNWFLEAEVSQGDLALLDEPEAFLAARAQRPFIDQVARQALAKDLQLIISTHSPEVLTRFPLSNIRMCVAGDDGIHIIRPKSMVQIRESVGLETPIRMLILVEDDLAKGILRLLFARYDRALVSEVEVVAAGGEGQIRNGLKILQGSRRLAYLGVFDGDKREIEIAERLPLLFLPGTSPPEDELLSSVSREAGWLAERNNVTIEDLLAATSSCRGLDHQYWIRTFAERLGIEESVVINELTQAWLRSSGIEKEARLLVRNIRSGIQGCKR